MNRILVAILCFCLGANAFALAGAEAFSGPMQDHSAPMMTGEPSASMAGMADHCDDAADTESSTLSCWSHCTMAHAAISDLVLVRLQPFHADRPVAPLQRQLASAIVNHWRPPINQS